MKKAITISFILLLCLSLLVYAFPIRPTPEDVAKEFLTLLYTGSPDRYESFLYSGVLDQSSPEQVPLEDQSIYTSLYEEIATENCMENMSNVYGNLFIFTDKFVYENNCITTVNNIGLGLEEEDDYTSTFFYTVRFTLVKDGFSQDYPTIGQIIISTHDEKASHIRLYDQLIFDALK